MWIPEETGFENDEVTNEQLWALWAHLLIPERPDYKIDMSSREGLCSSAMRCAELAKTDGKVEVLVSNYELEVELTPETSHPWWEALSLQLTTADGDWTVELVFRETMGDESRWNPYLRIANNHGGRELPASIRDALQRAEIEIPVFPL